MWTLKNSDLNRPSSPPSYFLNFFPVISSVSYSVLMLFLSPLELLFFSSYSDPGVFPFFSMLATLSNEVSALSITSLCERTACLAFRHSYNPIAYSIRGVWIMGKLVLRILMARDWVIGVFRAVQNILARLVVPIFFYHSVLITFLKYILSIWISHSNLW